MAKTSRRARATFMQVLRETGNQTIAAERAMVSLAWVELYRTTDPAFEAAVSVAASRYP